MYQGGGAQDHIRASTRDSGVMKPCAVQPNTFHAEGWGSWSTMRTKGAIDWRANPEGDQFFDGQLFSLSDTLM